MTDRLAISQDDSHIAYKSGNDVWEILRETDGHTLGCMIIAVQEIAGKSFALSSAAIERVDVDKIEKAKKVRFTFYPKGRISHEKLLYNRRK